MDIYDPISVILNISPLSNFVNLMEEVDAAPSAKNSWGMNPWNAGTKGLQEAWNKGQKTGPNSTESNRKRSETLKNHWKDKPGNRKGCKPWHAGTKGMGVFVPWNKGIKEPQISCPHCSTLGNKSNMKRWHFDNCRKKIIESV